MSYADVMPDSPTQGKVMRDGYEFPKSLQVDQTYELLKMAARKTKSDVQLRIELMQHFEYASRRLRIWSEKSDGNFRSTDKTGLDMSFTLERDLESDLISDPHFTKIQFNKFELPEFNDDNKRSDYTNSLVDALENSYREIFSQK